MRQRKTSETGYRTGLYSIEGRTNPVEREEVELEFMQNFDDAASRALLELETIGGKPKDAKGVTEWSRFVMSLVYRNPARVEDLATRAAKSEHDPKVQQAYLAAKSDDDPSTYEEYFKQSGALMDEELKAYLIRRVIDSKFVGQHLNNMHWHVGTIPTRSRDLVLSDSPVVTSNGVGIDNGFLLLPIGPRAFFMAVNSYRVRDFLLAENESGRLTGNLNNAVVKNAELLVIASSKSYKLFVDRRLVAAGAPIRDRVTWEI